MKSRNQINQAVRYALMAGAAAAVAMPTAFAQDQGASTTSSNQNTAQLGKIEVTGTRIKRTDVETAQPVTIVTQKEIQATGLTTVGDILQNLTQAGNALNTLFNNGGNGATNLDLRNLGSNRVLILVNGRRWIPSLGGSVDVNSIPASVIDHVEILQDGASAIYGSDAIAGVINFITVKNYNGAEASAYMGMYDGKNDGGGWDGKQQEYNFTIGSSGDRAGVVMNIDYTNQASIFAGKRTISKEAIWTQGGGSSATPSGRFIFAGPTFAGSTIGSGTCGPYNPASHSYGTCDLTLKSPTNSPSKANFRNFIGSGPADDHYNYAPANYLITPNERTSAYVQGHYDLADNLTFTTEVMYNQRNSNQSLAPSPIFLGLGSYTDNGKYIGVGAGNPYNPLGVDLVGNISQYCPTTGPGCPAANELLFLLGRRPIEGGNRVFRQNVSTYQFNSGFNGYFNLGGSEWDWDLGYNYGSINEFDSTTGLFNTGRLDYALSSACPSDPTCVPFNMFGGLGSITPDMLNYTQYEEHNTQQLVMRDYTANITGDIGDWFGAGAVGLALGGEQLENDGYFHPDATTAAGNTTGNTTQPTNGKQSTTAEYLEINIPILADMSFAKSLSLDLADRHSSVNWKGGTPGTTGSLVEHSASADTARWAIKYQPVDSLLLRASWSQGFRTPSISDLYSGLGTNYPAAADPCAGGKYGGFQGGALPPGCRGVQHKDQTNGQIQALGGGNAALTPEKAVSKTVGFVYNPGWAPGWDFSADYYHIQLTNNIGAIGAQAILNGCYQGTHPSYCSLITVQGNAVTQILNQKLNSGELDTSGIDVSTHYKLPSTSVGDFKIGLDWTFLRDYTSIDSDGIPTLQAGTTTAFGGFPKQKAMLSLNWNYGDWSANWDIKYVHSLYEIGCTNASLFSVGKTPAEVAQGECSDPGRLVTVNGKPTYPDSKNHLGNWFTHNVQATYHVESWNTDLSFGIRNLFDKQPPAAPNSAFANTFLPALYPIVPGRYFYGRVSVKF
jgi:iron complex outermembrane recepter protein